MDQPVCPCQKIDPQERLVVHLLMKWVKSDGVDMPPVEKIQEVLRTVVARCGEVASQLTNKPVRFVAQEVQCPAKPDQ